MKVTMMTVIKQTKLYIKWKGNKSLRAVQICDDVRLHVHGFLILTLILTIMIPKY